VEHQVAKKAAQPEWAQSPELARALALQERINPYHIFGDIQPLRMEEIFRNRQNRFRNRSSSANWITAGDAVTVEEEINYARRMGFQT
jgi:Inner centromere protein, ARK binding region